LLELVQTLRDSFSAGLKDVLFVYNPAEMVCSDCLKRQHVGKSAWKKEDVFGLP
jgi:hypothetical protein